MSIAVKEKESVEDVLKEGLDKFACFENLAMQEKNPKYCMYLPPPQNYRCLESFAYNYKVDDICSVVASSFEENEECGIGICNNKYHLSDRQNCTMSLVEKLKKSSLCDGIPVLKEYCYYTMAQELNDLTLCSKTKDVIYCEENVKNKR